MARKTAVWTAGPDCGRDAGKSFLLTEMSADQGERWATRLILALANAGSDLPEGILDTGMAGVATISGALVLSLQHLRGLRYEAVAPLLDEMMKCIQYQPNGTLPGGQPLPPQALFTEPNCQIEEITTRVKLRWEVLRLHVDFSQADAARTPAPTGTPAPQQSA